MPPWNSNGTFTRTDGTRTGPSVFRLQQVAPGVEPDPLLFDLESNDLAAGIEASLNKDGLNAPTASLPMGGNKHTNVADATARAEYASLGQLQDASGVYVTPTEVDGTADAITLTPATAITAYVANQFFRFKAESANTGAVTVAISSLAAVNLQKLDNTGAIVDLVADDIQDGSLLGIWYDGTRFLIVQGLISEPLLPVLLTNEQAYTDLADQARQTLCVGRRVMANQTFDVGDFTTNVNLSRLFDPGPQINSNLLPPDGVDTYLINFVIDRANERVRFRTQASPIPGVLAGANLGPDLSDAFENDPYLVIKAGDSVWTFSSDVFTNTDTAEPYTWDVDPTFITAMEAEYRALSQADKDSTTLTISDGPLFTGFAYGNTIIAGMAYGDTIITGAAYGDTRIF